MKSYTTPEIVIVELEAHEIADNIIQTSQILVSDEESENFSPRRRGSGWEDYEQ